MTCPHCQEPARFKGYRPKGLLSTLGPLTIEQTITIVPTVTKATAPATMPSAWTSVI